MGRSFGRKSASKFDDHVQQGKVTKTTLENIGFDYPSDVTLQPEVIFPQILRITPLTGFKSIGITSLGKGYIQSPSLVVLDGVTKKEITDVDLRYRPDELFVEILKNSETMNAATPTIVPIGNPNGIRVSNLVYDNDGEFHKRGRDCRKLCGVARCVLATLELRSLQAAGCELHATSYELQATD